jgi:hypothetical protein
MVSTKHPKSVLATGKRPRKRYDLARRREVAKTRELGACTDCRRRKVRVRFLHHLNIFKLICGYSASMLRNLSREWDFFCQNPCHPSHQLISTPPRTQRSKAGPLEIMDLEPIAIFEGKLHLLILNSGTMASCLSTMLRAMHHKPQWLPRQRGLLWQHRLLQQLVLICGIRYNPWTKYLHNIWLKLRMKALAALTRILLATQACATWLGHQRCGAPHLSSILTRPKCQTHSIHLQSQNLTVQKLIMHFLPRLPFILKMVGNGAQGTNAISPRRSVQLSILTKLWAQTPFTQVATRTLSTSVACSAPRIPSISRTGTREYRALAHSSTLVHLRTIDAMDGRT